MSFFSNRLTRLRKEKFSNRDDFANHMGINIHTYKAYESGRNEPKYDILTSLAREFDVTIDYLLGLDNVKRPVHADLPREENEEILLNQYRKLDERGKTLVLNTAVWMARDSNGNEGESGQK